MSTLNTSRIQFRERPTHKTVASENARVTRRMYIGFFQNFNLVRIAIIELLPNNPVRNKIGDIIIHR
jgi:hypothetical protein